jgi:membrane protein
MSWRFPTATYWASPNVKHSALSLGQPGRLVAVLTWILASAAFAFYVANFASYNKTYRSFGGDHLSSGCGSPTS